MTGITLTTATKTFVTKFYLNFESNPKKNEIWFLDKLLEIKLFIIIGFSVLFFSIMMYFNIKIYFKKVKFKKSKFKKRKNSKFLGQLFFLTISKCIIIGFIFLAIKEKNKAAQNPHKLVGKDYFLSIEYFGDTYHLMERQTKTLHGLYAMSTKIQII